MIRIFTGDDRVRAKKAIDDFLGHEYEIIEGSDLTPSDMPSIFHGSTLFSDQRHILIRDLSSNKSTFEKLPEYLNTSHDIALFELKLDKRSTTYKDLKQTIKIEEYNLPENPDFRLVFDIYKTAKTNGPKSIIMLNKIKANEDPMMFFGLLASQAIKDFAASQGSKQKTILKELSRADLQMKSSSVDPWLLIESFLLRLSSL